jgi:hypothetical protein
VGQSLLVPAAPAPPRRRPRWARIVGIPFAARLIYAVLLAHELLQLVLLAVTLAGQEAEGTGGAAVPATEIAWAWQYEALHAGKVEALHVIFSANGTATSCNIALMSDEGGKPGTVLAEAAIGSSTAGAHEAAIAATEVVAGTKYWLVVQGQGGTLKVKEGSTTAMRKASTKHAKISETTAAQWSAEEKRGPVSLWATGTEGGAGVAIPLNSASSTSTASLAVTAPTRVAVSAGASTSSAALAVTAPTGVSLAASASTSSGSGAITAPTAIPLASSSSTSSAADALTAPTQVPLTPGSSVSAATVNVTATTQVSPAAGASQSTAAAGVTAATLTPLVSAASTSTASVAVVVPLRLPLDAASATSTAGLTIAAPTGLPLATAASNSATSSAVTAATSIALDPGASSSTGSATVAALVIDLEPCDVTIRNLPQVIVTFRHFPAVDVAVINARRS